MQHWNGYGNRGGVDLSRDLLPAPYRRIRRTGNKYILEIVNDPAFTVDFERPQADLRAKNLIAFFKQKTTNIHLLRALGVLLAQPKITERRYLVTKFKEAIANLPKL